MKTDVSAEEVTPPTATTERPQSKTARGSTSIRPLDLKPQNSQPTSGKPPADKAEIMRKVEAAGTPGPAHKALDALVGNWKAEVKCWMEPGQAPNVTQGTAKAMWTLNGRFVNEEFHGEAMGKPFHGRSLIGFDNTKQKFNCVWVDDMHTSMFTSEGPGDAGYKTLTLEGKSMCPVSGEISMKQVFRILSPDKHVLEMFDSSKGDGAKSMEVTYTRQ